MKLASNLGMYEDEWKEEDWLFMYGEVPVIIILWPGALALVLASLVSSAVAPCGTARRGEKHSKIPKRDTGRVAARVRPRQSQAGYSEREMSRERQGTNSLFPDETANRNTSPAHAPHQAAGHALAAGAVRMIAVWVGHGDGLCAGADKRVLATAAGGRAEVWAGRHVDVDVEVEFGIDCGDAVYGATGDARIVVDAVVNDGGGQG